MLTVWLAALAAGVVQVETGGACPSATEVMSALEPLLPPAGDDVAPVRAHIEVATHAALPGSGALPPGSATPPSGTAAPALPPESELQIELWRGNERVAQRRVTVGESCGERAAVSAVVLATWERALASGAPLSLDALDRVPRAVPASDATPALVARARPRSRLEIDLDAAYFGSFASSDFTSGGLAEVRLHPSGPWPGVRLGVRGAGTRDMSDFTWTRAAFTVGADYRRELGRWQVGVDVNLQPALVVAIGHGVAGAHTAYSGDLGIGAGMRAGVRVASVTPFIGVGIAGWLMDTQVGLGPGTQGVSLPRFEVLFMAGVALPVRK